MAVTLPNRLLMLMLLALPAVSSLPSVPGSKPVPGRDKIQAQYLYDPPGFNPAACLPPLPPASLTQERGVIISVLATALAFLPPGGGATVQPLAALTTAGLGAVVPYYPDVTPLHPTGIPTRPAAEHTLVNRNTALIYGVYRVAEYFRNVIPGLARFVQGSMLSLGLDPSNTCTDLDQPACVGNVAAQAVLARLATDGWNSAGTVDRVFNGKPYQNYDDYVPKNTAYNLRDIYSWQPLLETDGSGYFFVQEGYSPQARLVQPIFVSAVDLTRTVPHPFLNPDYDKYVAQVDQILAASAALNDTTKMVAELFNSAEYAAVGLLYFSEVGNWSLKKTLTFFTGLAGLVHDGTVLALKEKYRLDTVRPMSAVRHVYGNTKVLAYAGPGQGIQNISGNEWVSYVRTSADPEHPSGAVCLCTIYAEYVELWVGANVPWNVPYFLKQGCSKREFGITPTADMLLIVSSKAELIKMCQNARVWGGVHFPNAVRDGQLLCTGLAVKGYAKMQELVPQPDAAT